MKNLIEHAPGVAETFFGMTAAIREHSPFTARERELILLGIITANKAPKALITHVTRAIEAGATQQEIVSAITLALPLSGVACVNSALEVALDTYNVVVSNRETP